MMYSDNNEKMVEEEDKKQIVSSDHLVIPKTTPEYLQELINDMKQLKDVPSPVLKHTEKILENEIIRVKETLFHFAESVKNGEKVSLETTGRIVTVQEKIFVPVKDHPKYNFVGRLLGPRGLTAKQMEQDLYCKIMVRGQGSLRDKQKENENRGKPNWEHLEEDLHVLVSVEDYENRAQTRLKRAIEAIKVFLEKGLKTPEAEDEVKRRQLLELAVLKGGLASYSPPTSSASCTEHPAIQPLFISSFPQMQNPGLQNPGLLTTLSHNLPFPNTMSGSGPGFQFHQGQPPTDPSAALLASYRMQQARAAQPFFFNTIPTAGDSAGAAANPYLAEYTFDAFSPGQIKFKPSINTALRPHPYHRLL